MLASGQEVLGPQGGPSGAPLSLSPAVASVPTHLEVRWQQYLEPQVPAGSSPAGLSKSLFPAFPSKSSLSVTGARDHL